MNNFAEINEFTKEEKINKCIAFYEELCARLSETHEVVGSCNKDISSYLIPIGSVNDLSYHGKPDNSFRFSDHWNWFSNTNKCEDERYVQCYSPDVPWTRPRPEPNKPSKPRFAIMVAYYGNDKKYHTIFGEKFDRRSKSWDFVMPTVDEIIEKLA